MSLQKGGLPPPSNDNSRGMDSSCRMALRFLSADAYEISVLWIRGSCRYDRGKTDDVEGDCLWMLIAWCMGKYSGLHSFWWSPVFICFSLDGYEAGLRLQVWGNKAMDIILRLHSNISVSSWTIIYAHKFVEGIQDNGGTKAIVNTIPHLKENNSPMSIDRHTSDIRHQE